ncbi:hypothetical protein E2C01_036996 [Portunus trituberculatus]|uniref:Uncharacterized protein n=1 Tax=Portunus trituberculatus TaxID=210409 RepID=A0A5B7F860_PORTR|nr:hypothetical protein [Portunus trituberculatus]
MCLGPHFPPYDSIYSMQEGEAEQEQHERLTTGELDCVVRLKVVLGIVFCVVFVVCLILCLVFCGYRRRRQRDKLMGRGWPPGPLAPWPPDDHAAATRHIMADDYGYHAYSVRHVPVTKV